MRGPRTGIPIDGGAVLFHHDTLPEAPPEIVAASAGALPARLGAFVNKEALDPLPRLERVPQPQRLEAAARPGLRWIFRIAILWGDWSQRPAGPSRCTSFARVVTGKIGKLCLEFSSAG
jgi:hypothetical protein